MQDFFEAAQNELEILATEAQVLRRESGAAVAVASNFWLWDGQLVWAEAYASATGPVAFELGNEHEQLVTDDFVLATRELAAEAAKYL